MPGASALACDAKKLRFPQGLCSGFTAAALLHPACVQLPLSSLAGITSLTLKGPKAGPAARVAPGLQPLGKVSPFPPTQHMQQLLPPLPRVPAGFWGSSPLVSPPTSAFCSWRLSEDPRARISGRVPAFPSATSGMQQQAAGFACHDLHLLNTGAISLPFPSPTGGS